jgi:hypothetical protein
MCIRDSSGIGKLNDVHLPQVIRGSQQIYGEHPLLAGIAKYLGISHNSSIQTESLAGAFAWLDRPETIWHELSYALTHQKIDQLLLIDFPNGKVRERILTAKDLHKKSWVFWKKAEPLTWKEIISS